MALMKDYNSEIGYTFTEAYCKIISLNICNVNPKETYFTMHIYTNKDCSDTHKQVIGLYSNSFIYNIESDLNVLEQAYAYCKTLSDFENAIDC